MQNIKKYEQKIAIILVFILLLLWFSLFLMEKINLTTADLGRHIKNGEIVLSSGLQGFNKSDIFAKNFYSYTNPDFPFINHHWGSGVIFYLIFKIGGFFALSFFYIALSILTFGIFFFIAKKEAGLLLAAAFSMVLIPLMASRPEIRPEVFTYLFSGIFFFICYFSQKSLINPKWLYLLIPLSLVWINLHIAFFFGFIIMGIFLAEELLALILSYFSKWKNILPKGRIKELAISFALSLFAIILNPNELTGALEPLKIFKNYGYLVVENQSIGFLEKLNHTTGLNFPLFKISFLALLLSFVLVLIIKRKNFSLSNCFLATTVSFMAYMGIRNFPFFGFFALPIMANNFAIVITGFKEKIAEKEASSLEKNLHSAFKKAILIISIIVIIIGFLVGFNHIYGQRTTMGLGLMPEVNGSAEFFKENNIKGPIFNNYDIGGYLIYHLFPEHKVFVDNRPEAYPVSFFKEIYVPTQKENKKWEELDLQYNFNAIFFSWRDYTPWGQNFLLQRIKDENWAPVFVDGYNIIFIKKTAQNEDTIKKYELPKEMFRETKNI